MNKNVSNWFNHLPKCYVSNVRLKLGFGAEQCHKVEKKRIYIEMFNFI